MRVYTATAVVDQRAPPDNRATDKPPARTGGRNHPADAGVTLAVALVSALTGQPVRGDAAMSGELTYLSTSIDRIADNLLAFKAGWAYLHKNLSGKYRVTVIGGNVHAFAALRSQTDLVHVPNGVYLEFDRPIPVELVLSDADLSDFYVPNGQFSNDQSDSFVKATSSPRWTYCSLRRRAAGHLTSL